MTSPKKPVIVAMAFPGDGHSGPILRACCHLATQGFMVWLIASSEYESPALSVGVSRFFRHPNHFMLFPEILRDIVKVPPGMARTNYSFTNVFVRHTPLFVSALQNALEEARREFGPERRVVVLQDIFAGGALPFLYGAPLPAGYDKFPPVISLNVSVLFCTSTDAPPLGTGVSPIGREGDDMLKLHEAVAVGTLEGRDLLNKILKDMACTRLVEGSLADAWHHAPDLTLQPCSPSLEFKRRDLSPKIRFVGGLPLSVPKGSVVPDWLREYATTTKGGEGKRKKLVFVTQGTVDIDHHQLLIPTLRALRSRDDVFVVAVLGSRSAKLPEDVESSLSSPNTLVLDYFPYNEILPYADVFIANGGYGGFMHGVMNGVPMIIAGKGKDKADVAMRVEYAGLGVDLQTAMPSSEQVAAAVDQVLSNPAYRQKAAELKKENEDMNALEKIEEAVMELSTR